jgi:uncharacterized protein
MMPGRRMLIGVSIVAAGLLLMLALLWLGQRRLIYFPSGAVPPVTAILPTGEPVVLTTDDGLRLGGWFVPAVGTGTTQAAVLVCNGNAGNRAHRAPLAAVLARAGVPVLLFDYRGYGGNPGRPSERGLLSDARAARAYLASREDVDPDRIVYFGESLGAAVAVALATEQPPAALVLRSPFTSLADVGRVHYPFLPVRLLLRDRYTAIEQIGRVAAPVLVVAGARDEIIPPEHSRRVYEAAVGPKRWVLIPDADHNHTELLAGERFIREIVAFLAEHAGTAVRQRQAGRGS